MNSRKKSNSSNDFPKRVKFLKKEVTLLDFFLWIRLWFILHGHEFNKGILDKIFFLFLKHTILDLLLLLFQFKFDFSSNVQIIHPLVHLLCLGIEGKVHGFGHLLFG